jgi:hypothetical protein
VPCSSSNTSQSTLALFVARVGANHTHHALTTDDLAITADGFDRSRNSHFILLKLFNVAACPQPWNQ